jgi:septum formation protein
MPEMKKIILASQSPRRKQLLEWADIDFETVISATDETYPGGLSAEEVSIYIAKQKADAVAEMTGRDNIIIAADTIVVLGEEIIGKPKDREDAIAILTRLSGQKHRVITGIVILADQEIRFSDSTDVWLHELSAEQIVYYVDHYKPYDKAGAYAIQEWIGVVGIKRIEGDFYNVMGLPVSRVYQAINTIKL